MIARTGTYSGKKILILIITLCTPILLIAQSNHPFPPNERLQYDAKFGFLNLGSMELEISDTNTIDGTLCYAISSRLNSNPDLHFIFSLNDTINVFTTVNELLPVYYEKRVHEGKYINYHKIHFYHESLFVKVNDTVKVAITEPSRDLLSFWYFLRRIALIQGDTIRIALFEGKEQHIIECIVRRKEIVKTPLGKFSAIRVTPQTKGKGVFGSSGSMDIWYTDDSKRLPVQIKTNLKFGTVTFKLTGVSY